MSDSMKKLKCRISYHENKRESHLLELRTKRGEGFWNNLSNLSVEDLITIHKTTGEFLKGVGSGRYATQDHHRRSVSNLAEEEEWEEELF